MISGDFPAQSVCKKIRYCCFSHSTPVAADGRRWVHETPLFPPESAVSLCLFSVSLFLFKPCHPVVECERVYCMYLRLPVCTYPHMNVCVPVFLFLFFFDWINCGSHVCVETVWGLVVSCPLTFDFLLPLPVPFPTAALVPYIGPAVLIQLKMSD